MEIAKKKGPKPYEAPGQEKVAPPGPPSGRADSLEKSPRDGRDADHIFSENHPALLFIRSA